MRVQSFLTATAAPSPARHREALAPLPNGLAGELTRILTEMIVARKELETHEV